MPTIGLDKVYVAELKDDIVDIGTEYEKPIPLVGAISAGVEHTSDSAVLDADDHQTDVFNNYGGTTVTLGLRDLTPAAACLLQGHKLSATGGVIRSAQDAAPYVALLYRAMRPDGTYQYCVLYKGKFKLVGRNSETKKKGGVTFQTPSLSADFIARDSDGQFEYYVNETEESKDEVAAWYDDVPEPTPA